jgi:hypothetical protein
MGNNPRQLLVSFFVLETHKFPVAKFIVPDWDKVDSGISANRAISAGRPVRQPFAGDNEFGYLYTVMDGETIGFEQLHELKVLSSEEAL